MKPRSIRQFDMLFPLAALLVLASAILSFGSLEARTMLDFGVEGEGARGMAIWMVIASLFIFTLLAAIFWATVSVMRLGFVRFLLAAIVVYALYQNYLALSASTPNLASLVDVAASVVGAVSVTVLFRADARAWFAEKPGDSDLP